jgi:pyrroline-5-carboxylate reductase
MNTKSIGFIGGGRITRLMLEGFTRGEVSFREVIVSDLENSNLDILRKNSPEFRSAGQDNSNPAQADLVFLAIHPPAMESVLKEIAPHIKKTSIVISLAPKFTIALLSSALGSHTRIVRMIPNAPSIINAGYNPISFAAEFTSKEKDEIRNLLLALGQCPEVEEEKLEAYAMITAMGPAYLWFQWHHLHSLAVSFGLNHDEAARAMIAMIHGAEQTLFESGLSPDVVMDLIPSKPLKDDEQTIQAFYTARLQTLYSKLKN